MSRPSPSSGVRGRVAAAACGAVLLIGSLAGCGSSQGAPADADTVEVTASPTPAGATPDGDGVVVRIKATADDIDPAGERVQVDRGEPLVLLIDATEAGELHVHSTPGQEISYPTGSSTATLVFDRPGVIEVESHALDKLVVQVEVR